MKPLIATHRPPWHVIRYANADHYELRDAKGVVIGRFPDGDVAEQIKDIVNSLYYRMREGES